MKEKKVLEKLHEHPIPEIYIESLGEYCDVVDLISETWRKKVAERQINQKPPADFYCGELSPWFRGVSNESYEPKPVLFRFYEKAIFSQYKGVENLSINQLESYFLQRFKTFGSPFLEKLPKNDIEWHFLMRHHNVPNRLLDWSKGSFIGLYFATRKSLDALNPLKSHESKKSDSAVWILEPRRLSEMYNSKRNIYGSSKRDFQDAIDAYFNKHLNPQYPLPIIPDLIAPRIESHIGRFTLHPFSDAKVDNSKALMQFAKDTYDKDRLSYLVKMIIPYKCHLGIARSLRSTGVSDMNFSQDLDGLSEELALRVNIGRKDHNRFAEEILS